MKEINRSISDLVTMSSSISFIPLGNFKYIHLTIYYKIFSFFLEFSTIYHNLWGHLKLFQQLFLFQEYIRKNTFTIFIIGA